MIARKKTVLGFLLASIVVLGVNATLWAEVNAGELSDPTKPYHAKSKRKAVSPRVLRVQSILISSNGRYATINGKHVTVGDMIQGARVTKILPNEVILLQGGRKKTLTMVSKIKVRHH